MAQKTDAQLSVEAQQIKNEVVENANTATRVGGHLQNLTDSKANKSLLLTDWDMSTDAFPANSIAGQEYIGSNGPTVALVIVVDGEEQVIPDETIIKSRINNASTTDPSQWILIPTIKQD